MSTPDTPTPAERHIARAERVTEVAEEMAAKSLHAAEPYRQAGRYWREMAGTAGRSWTPTPEQES